MLNMWGWLAEATRHARCSQVWVVTKVIDTEMCDPYSSANIGYAMKIHGPLDST